MELETYETVTFSNRLMQAIEQIRAVSKKMEKLPLNLRREQPEEDKFLRQCSKELHDAQNTLLILKKEALYYMTQ